MVVRCLLTLTLGKKESFAKTLLGDVPCGQRFVAFSFKTQNLLPLSARFLFALLLLYRVYARWGVSCPRLLELARLDRSLLNCSSHVKLVTPAYTYLLSTKSGAERSMV
jgi:hypothetical protein